MTQLLTLAPTPFRFIRIVLVQPFPVPSLPIRKACLESDRRFRFFSLLLAADPRRFDWSGHSHVDIDIVA
jgi:hypothetical protein